MGVLIDLVREPISKTLGGSAENSGVLLGLGSRASVGPELSEQALG